ncbi:hypothetical protein ELI_3716 [Eubacterium callanderi]|uniref:Uncharacterized protein n=1 Tax=Eubacterium callanderi TaxID=53442 RepID=E3GPU3_9FIRM|nr:hypothetical protein ELI_3716 [Eubacterium callanderi]
MLPCHNNGYIFGDGRIRGRGCKILRLRFFYEISGIMGVTITAQRGMK